jgi:tetratricopeptide (TPR) repeat protein
VRRLLNATIVTACALTLGACSHMPDFATRNEPAGGAEFSARERVRVAIDWLGQGDERRARAELRAVLEAQPNNGVARRLVEQMDADPRALLGGNARPYTVRSGETMSQIAERYLGDGLLFYALARYNNINAPNQLAAGQRLMIPQRAAGTVEAAAVREPAPIEPTVSTPPRAAPSSRADRLRLQALERLNAGQVDGAVTLLRQALALDPNNPAIQRDLERAARLQTSLRSSGR